eukprot:Em0003g1146a
MTTVNDSHPEEEEGMIIDNGHPDEYETQHTSSEDSLTPYANKTLKPDDQIRMYVMREAKAKLEYGSSVSEIEEHLRNAAALIGDELEELFINGEEVYFAGTKEGSGNGEFPTLRTIPLFVTADSKAHCEIGLTNAGGYRGCRRCFLGGTYVPEKRHYYYGNFRYRYRYPVESRTAVSNRRYGLQVDAATSEAERKRMSKETGVTGECIFYRLYDLCGFDPVNDLIIDAMHAMILNMVKTELEVHLLADLGPNADLPIEERTPALGGLLDRKMLADALQRMEWTTEMKDGRIPRLNLQYHGKGKLGHWKSEELGKFITIAPVILRGLIPKQAYNCFCLLSEMHHLVFSERMRIEGWQPEHLDYFKKLLWKHAIMFEELYGLSSCTENLEYSLHMPEDIVRFSTLDNYWCYVFERDSSVRRATLADIQLA